MKASRISFLHRMETYTDIFLVRFIYRKPGTMPGFLYLMNDRYGCKFGFTNAIVLV